jgi:hypothetical protein
MLVVSVYPEGGRVALHQLVDLAAGTSLPLPSPRVALSADGRWLVRPDGEGRLAFRPVGGGDERHVELPHSPGAGDAADGADDTDLVDVAVGTRRLGP